MKGLDVEARIGVACTATVGPFDSQASEVPAERSHVRHLLTKGHMALFQFGLSNSMPTFVDLFGLDAKLGIHGTLEPLDLRYGSEFDLLVTVRNMGVRRAWKTIGSVLGLVHHYRFNGLRSVFSDAAKRDEDSFGRKGAVVHTTGNRLGLELSEDLEQMALGATMVVEWH